MQNLIKRFSQFFENLKSEDKVAVFHHSDTDGICSAVLAAKIVERVRGKKIDLRLNTEPSKHAISHEHLQDLKKNNITKLVCVDCSVEQELETVKEAEKFAEVLVIDHHKVYDNLNSTKTIFIKPQMLYENEDGARYCVAKFLFDLLKNSSFSIPKTRLTSKFSLSSIDISDLDWISVIGVIGDMNHRRWGKFVDAVFKKYKLKQDKDIYKTVLGKISNLINYAAVLKEQETVFWKIYSARNPAELLKLLKEYAIVEREVNYWIKNYKKLAEFHPEQNLIFYEIEPKKYPVKSLVISQISKLHPNITVIAVQISREQVTISARRQDYKIKVNDLLRKAVEGLPKAEAGGHIPAAGGVIRAEDLPEFKKRIIKILSNSP